MRPFVAATAEVGVCRLEEAAQQWQQASLGEAHGLKAALQVEHSSRVALLGQLRQAQQDRAADARQFSMSLHMPPTNEERN